MMAWPAICLDPTQRCGCFIFPSSPEIPVERQYDSEIPWVLSSEPKEPTQLPLQRIANSCVFFV